MNMLSLNVMNCHWQSVHNVETITYTGYAYLAIKEHVYVGWNTKHVHVQKAGVHSEYLFSF